MDTIRLKSGIHGVATSAIPLAGSIDGRALGHCQVSAAGRSNFDKSKVVATPQKTGPSPSSLRFSFRYPLKSLWFGSNRGGDNEHGRISLGDTPLLEIREKSDTSNLRTEGEIETPAVPENRDGNWVLKFLHLQPGNKEEDVKESLSIDLDKEYSSTGTVKEEDGESDEKELCDACRVHFNGQEEVEIDRDTFLRFLHRVSLDQAKFYAKMAYLGNLAYGISDIKITGKSLPFYSPLCTNSRPSRFVSYVYQPAKLLKSRGLRLVTSSLEKRKLATKAVDELFHSESKLIEDASKDPKKEGGGYSINPSIAYQVAASAVSYLHSHMKDILSTGPPDEEEAQGSLDDGVDYTTNSDMVSFMATSDSVTAMVTAEEKVKQALADDLNSTYSSPCEWFVCDDDESSTRFFVIQGSESLASWQANLLFEPIEFEGFNIHVHRGIYEAAKGIYKQILPEIRSHLNTHGNHATFRFTGHSLGGSLSLLINLMLLIRGEVPLSSLLPVITFGAPSIMCGGDRLLRQLGLPRSHVQAVTMHRDVVPRAFSCIYPDHVVQLLKAMNGSFRDHPCLKKEKILYAPMGELLILQPDEKFSPQHHLLPSGSGLYLLSCSIISDISDEQKKQLQAAAKLFFNSPHPIEILSDRSAYGTGGTIQRDHDISSYVKCLQKVVRQELQRIRKAKRERRSQLWWPLIFLGDINDGIILDRTLLQQQFNLSRILENSRESIGKSFSRHLASQRMDLFMLLLFPARLLLLRTDSTISIH